MTGRSPGATVRASSRRPGLPPVWLRRACQLGILGSVLWLAFGQGRRSFEAFCPFGGVEAAWGLFRERTYSCSTSEMNVAMFFAVMALALVAGKAFCGWLCPIGLLNEMLFKVGQAVPWLRRRQVPLRIDRWLRFLRYPFTALFVILTWKAGELLLRGYDPFYIIFSGFGHGTLGVVSVAALAITLLAALVIPMFWCRALCPLGAVQDILARFGLVRIHREAGACTNCGACDQVCPQRLAVSRPATVASIDCTRCLDCLEACPTGALTVGLAAPHPGVARARFLSISRWLVPVPVAASLLFGLRISEPLTLPTAEATFYDPSSLAEPLTVEYTVEGVKCHGTATFFIRRVSSLGGVAEVRAFAGLRRAEITIDRHRITPEALRDSINAPIRHPKTDEEVPDVFRVVAMKVR